MNRHRAIRTLVITAFAGTLATACATPAPSAPSDVVTSVAMPLPGNASIARPVAEAPPEISDCTASLRPPAMMPPPNAMPANSSMAAIHARGRLIVGLDIGSNLLSFRDPITGQVSGFDVDIARQIASAIFGDPARIEFRILSSQARVEAIVNDTVDVVVKTMSATCDRAKKVGFSSTYLEAEQRILALRGTTIDSVANLADKRVCAIRGSTSLIRIQQLVPTATIIEPDTWGDCLVALQQNQADVISTDAPILAGLVTQDPNLSIIGPVLGNEPYAVGINKNKEDLIRFVNGVLQNIRNDGTWMSLYNRWFQVVLGPSWYPPLALYSD